MRKLGKAQLIIVKNSRDNRGCSFSGGLWLVYAALFRSNMFQQFPGSQILGVQALLRLFLQVFERRLRLNERSICKRVRNRFCHL